MLLLPSTQDTHQPSKKLPGSFRYLYALGSRDHHITKSY